MKTKSISTPADRRGSALCGGIQSGLFCLLLPLFFTSCNQDEAQLSLLVDSFNSQIESKNKELEQVRASETQLRTQMAEISGRMQEMEAQLGDLKKSPSVTPDAVAGAVLEKIKPSLQELASNIAKSVPPASAAVSPNPAGAQGQAPAVPPADGSISSPRVEGGPARDNVQRHIFSFP
jgi:cell division protein FtsB